MYLFSTYWCFKPKNGLFSHPCLVWCPCSGNPLDFLDETYPSKTRGPACQKLLLFDVLTTLSPTILVYLHAFSYCGVRNLRNPEKFTENSNLWSSRSPKVINLGANRKPICNLLLVINGNFSRICYRFRDIHGYCSTVFVWYTHVTDRQTDGRTIAYRPSVRL